RASDRSGPRHEGQQDRRERGSEDQEDEGERGEERPEPASGVPATPQEKVRADEVRERRDRRPGAPRVDTVKKADEGSQPSRRRGARREEDRGRDVRDSLREERAGKETREKSVERSPRPTRQSKRRDLFAHSTATIRTTKRERRPRSKRR